MSGNRKVIFLVALLLLTLVFAETKKTHTLDTVHVDRAGDRKGQRQQPSPVDDTTSEEKSCHANYMSQSELEVIAEINLLRSDPPAYAHLRIEPLREDYHGKLFFHPDRSPVPIQTIEGVAALDECIRVLENTKPMPPLSPSEGLTLAAREMTQDQGATKNTGHIGSCGSTMSERIEHYGEWAEVIAENISYGFKKPKDIIAFLLIDDGVADRGHRITLLDNELNRAGVSIGPHLRYKDMCVIEFAAGFITKKP